jgi:hypothetical protein
MSRTLRLLCCTAAGICIGLSASVATAQSPVCEQSPIENRWPEVIAPMLGQSPAWLVDGAATWVKDDPVKTIWVILRRPGQVRITGHRTDGVAAAKFIREWGDPPSNELVIENPNVRRIIPHGASAEVLRQYLFFGSNVIYGSPGCWEFDVVVGDQTSRIVKNVPLHGAR